MLMAMCRINSIGRDWHRQSLSELCPQLLLSFAVAWTGEGLIVSVQQFVTAVR